MSSNQPTTNSTRLQLPLYQLSKCGTIIPADEQSEASKDKDWRGLVKLWEPPRPRARYVMGIDPAGGIVNWDRVRRLNDDRKKDDSAIEIIKCGDGRTVPDVQVAEFRAPISAEDIAPIAVLFGRLYAGNSESNEALCVIETYPGPGMLTHTAMIQKHGYTNMWRWEYLDKMLPTIANSYGWTSNVKTLDYLWNKFSRHVGKHLFTIRSRALLDQMGNLQHMPNKTFPLACGEVVHDDLVRAAAMAVWVARDWLFADEPIPEPQVINGGRQSLNPQSSDMTSEQYDDWAEDMFASMLDGN